MRSQSMLLLLLAAVAPSARGQGTKKDVSQWRCRNRKPMCKQWAGRGECTSNYPFMAEECPAACDFCANAGLAPTPAAFELDYVCKKKRAPLPASLESIDHVPDGCGFACRDNMTACEDHAAAGKCKSHAEVMRVQCPGSCGVCKALGLPVASAADYPKPVCADAEEHGGACGNWARSGECLSNWGFMSLSCPGSCGLCRAPKAAGAGGEGKKKEKKGKKGKKKAGEEETVVEAAAAAPDADAAADASARPEVAGRGPPVPEASRASRGGGAIPSSFVPEEAPSTAKVTPPKHGGEEAAPGSAAPEEAAKPDEPAKPKGGGFVSSVKKAVGRVGDAFRGKKEQGAKGEL